MAVVVCVFWAQAAAAVAAWSFEPPRPLVVVFAGNQGSSTPSKNTNGLGASAAGGDALTPGERSLRAAQAVRERLDEAGIFTTALYSPDAALFLRAMHEGKIKLSSPDAPDEKERRALGKAAGAVYVVWVGASQTLPDGMTGRGKNNRPANPVNSIEIELQGTDVATGSGYTDRSLTQAGAGFSEPFRSNNDDSNAVPNANRRGSLRSNALLSAANTLVVRLFAGPLREFAGSAPPLNLLPPSPTTAPADAFSVQADNDSQNSSAALAQAEGLLGAGDTSAAIVLLRRSISLYPTNLYLRATLARAYGRKLRWDDAAGEARRALTLVPVPDVAAGESVRTKDAQTRQELTRLFSDALRQNNDLNAARQAYEQIIAGTPDAKASVWARIAYADLLLQQNKPAEAQVQLKAVLAVDAQNAEAPALLARFYASQGDYKNALAALSETTNAPEARSRAATAMFDEGATRLADTLTQNRAAWETGKITREGMYKATQAQAVRVGLLADLLKSAPSSAPAGSGENKAYLRRVHAASVLVQAVSSLMNLLDSGDKDAGDEANLLLGEFRKEIGAAQAAAPPGINTGINR